MAAALQLLAEKLRLHQVDAHTLKPLGPEGLATLEAPGGAPAIELWQALRRLASETWYWPVLLGSAEDAGLLDETLEDERGAPTAALLAAVDAERPDPRAWLAEELGGGGEATEVEDPDEGWPDVPPPEDYILPYDIVSRRPLPAVAIGLVPTRAPWEVPVYLRFGGWNACPDPVRHAALMKKWHVEYGAEVVGISRDVVEMRVQRPPTTRQAARALALEQYLYCADIVEQGVGSVGNLAAGLLRAPSWYFWWD